MKKWFLDADYLQACNCNFGCPCEFWASPSYGSCDGMGAWRINKGEYDGTRLDGLGLGFVAKWPGAIFEGNGTGVILIDEKASPEQREALEAIVSGRAGGMPFEVLGPSFTTREPSYVAFDFNIDGNNSSVRAGNVLRIALKPMKNPVTGEADRVMVDHSSGFVFDSAEATSTRESEVALDGMEFSYTDRAGFIARTHYHN